MTFSFGQIVVQITDKTTIGYTLFPKWVKYQTDAKDVIPDVEINIEEGTIPQFNAATSGWSFTTMYGEQVAVYSTEEKKIFALRYGKQDRKVKVIIAELARQSVRLGIQYGLLLALHQKCIGLHGVTVLCGNEVIILSAPSGTGKTTLSKLLEDYCDAIAINGDFALLNPTESGLVFEPTPFCGSSGRSLNHRFPVHRIVFLGQSKTNKWQELTGREAIARFMSNVFIPIWDDSMRQTVQNNVMKCISSLKVNFYEFAPTKEAADVFFKQLSYKSD